MEMVGAAAILPIVNIAMGAELYRLPGCTFPISSATPQRSDSVVYLGIVSGARLY